MKKHKMHSMDYSFNKDWTLFLDRDGVINTRLVGDYVKTPEEFHFIEGVPDSIRALSEVFGRIIIVTNQQGIGKGLMTEEDLQEIHAFMMKGIREAGGRIDAIYFSPHLESEKNRMRKPGVGMALHAQQDFPEIDFNQSVMVGDGLHDMEFGRKLGMVCVYIGSGESSNKGLWDVREASLPDFVAALTG
jgi:histidinol-phosphate phosphatase family protein